VRALPNPAGLRDDKRALVVRAFTFFAAFFATFFAAFFAQWAKNALGELRLGEIK